MTAKNIDPTPPDGLPLPTAARAGRRYRCVIIDDATGEVVTQGAVSSLDILREVRREGASGGIAGVASEVKGRRPTRVEQRRAHLDAIRSSKREGGKRRSEASSVMGRRFTEVPPALVADLVARGHLEPEPVGTKKHDPSRVAMRAADEAAADELVSTLVGLPVSGDRCAVSDFEAEADRLSLPLGTAPDDEVALQRLKVVAADATDIFPDMDAAIAFLTARPLDGRGRNGIEILRQKGLPGIISSLDQRRFGYSG